MAASVFDYLKSSLIKIDGIGVTTARRIASYFGELNDFKSADYFVFQNITYQHNGTQKTINITDKQYNAIKSIQNGIEENDSLLTLYVKIIIGDFLEKVKKNINDLSLDSMNCNPFLGAALKLAQNPDKFFEFNVWSSIQRSIVTSFGTTIEKLLHHCAEDVKKGTSPDGGEKWDLLKTIEGVNHWLEIKSGPNDMDKTQIQRYRNKMEKAEARGEVALFGFSYGRIERATVTLQLLDSYIDNWEEKVKIGGDLWSFLSEQDDYADSLMELISLISGEVFENDDIISLIKSKKQQIILEFEQNYNSLDEYLSEQY